MSQKAIFTYNLNSEEKNSWITFLKKQKRFSRYQHPDWVEIKKAPGKICFYMLFVDSELIAVSIIIENKFAANIDFGPICNSEDNYVESIDQIVNYYKKQKKFALLRVTQPILISSKSEKIEYSIYKKIKHFQKIDKENWTSAGIDLTRDIELIEKGYNSNHKRSIKKSLKANTYIKLLTQNAQLKELSQVFDKMWESRGLPNIFHSQTKLDQMFGFFKDQEQGLILGIYNENDIMLGGIVLFFEGKTIYYDSGASNPEFRKIPVMHRLIHEAIKYGHENGFELMDLGGYNLLVSEKDQIHNINRFKDGFAAELLVYPKKMYFVLNSWLYRPFNFALRIRNKLG